MGIIDKIIAIISEEVAKVLLNTIEATLERRFGRLERQVQTLKELVMLNLSTLEAGVAGLVSAIAQEKAEVMSAVATLDAKIAELQALVTAGFQPTPENLAQITALSDAIAAAAVSVSEIVTTPVVIPPAVESVVEEVVDSPANPLTEAEAEAAVVEG